MQCNIQHLQKWNQGGHPGHSRHQRFWKAAAKQSIHQKPNERDNRNQPKRKGTGHSFIKSTWSTFKVLRVRKRAMIIASPTAASAAATTITKKTKICPLTWCQRCAKATKVRFTAFSISSIDINTVIMLRLIRNAAT